MRDLAADRHRDLERWARGHAVCYFARHVGCCLWCRYRDSGPALQQTDKPEAFSQLPRYSKSKLLLVLFLSRLAALVGSDDCDELLVNMANPSMTRGTAFFRDVPTVALKPAASVWFLLARTVAVGASTYIDAAMAQSKMRHGALTSDWAIKSCVISTLSIT